MTLEIYTVNAFTAHGKNGNPAGVVLDAEDMTAPEMQKIAAEVGFAETAFVSKSQKADRRVRFFTPTTEVDLCGHATIATWSLMHSSGILPAGHYAQETGAGVLRVRIHEDGLVFMEQAKPVFSEEVEARIVAPMLGISEADFHPTLKPQIVSTGLRDLMVSLANKATLARLQPDMEAIAAFSRAHDSSGFHVFALLDGKDVSESIAAARNFAPADGIPEECATGTSNGALLCYLKEHGALPEQKTYRTEQGEAMGRLSYVYETFTDGSVWVGGHATQVPRP